MTSSADVALSFFHRLTFELPSQEEEWFSVELFARGADGVSAEVTELGVQLIAYCPDPLPPALAEVGDSWLERGIHLRARQRCASQDWLAAYRAASVALEVGRRFVVDPGEPIAGSEPDDEVPGGRTLLRIPARRAFGTGSHASTQLVVEWLEDLELSGRRVLDLGSGTGILSLAASSLGAATAIGIDIDPVACFVAAEIQRLNRFPLCLVAGDLSCLGEVAFDVALVNILPGEWLGGSTGLARVLAPEGYAILSGLLCDEADDVSTRLSDAGLETLEQRTRQEWAALRVRRIAA